MFKIYLPADTLSRKWPLCYTMNIKRQTECTRNNTILHSISAYKEAFPIALVHNLLRLASHRSLWGWTVGRDTNGLIQTHFLYT